MVPTQEWAGATSSGADSAVSVTTTGGWSPTSHPDQPAASTSSATSSIDGPRITFETAAGHTVILTYHDMAMLALLGTVAIAASRGVR